jgi:hypothetical protein
VVEGGRREKEFPPFQSQGIWGNMWKRGKTKNFQISEKVAKNIHTVGQ